MTNEERFKKYVEEHCKNCENKNKFLCNIRIFKLDGIIETKCNYYKKEEIKKEKKKLLYTTANKSKPLMKGLV